MARLSPTPVGGGYRSAGSFTQTSSRAFQPVVRVGLDDPAGAASTRLFGPRYSFVDHYGCVGRNKPLSRDPAAAALVSHLRVVSLIRRKIRCALDRQLLQTEFGDPV
jgi:hypothetical protein